MQEAKLYTTFEFIMVVLGGCIALSGVWVIIKKPTRTGKDDDDTESAPGVPKPKTIIPSARSVIYH